MKKTIVREPLLHFLVLAAVLFLADAYWSATRKEQIVIDRQTADYLIEQREYLELRELSPAERKQVIDLYVEDEILYREAYKRGLDQGDSRMRRNLILKMRGLLVRDVKEPTEEELRAYFDANAERFTSPATVSLQHVFFTDLAAIPDGLLEQLRAGRDPTGVGDYRAGFGTFLPDLSQEGLVSGLGQDAAAEILRIKDDQWHGPIESLHGSHFVKVIERSAVEAASFEQVRGFLGGDWRMYQSREAVADELERVRSQYDIVIEGSDGAAQ